MDETVFTMGKELDMKEEMKRTLATPKLPMNVMLKIMFLTFDLLYGKARSLPKVLVPGDRRAIRIGLGNTALTVCSLSGIVATISAA